MGFEADLMIECAERACDSTDATIRGARRNLGAPTDGDGSAPGSAPRQLTMGGIDSKACTIL
jgi:hypothetical protein